MENVVDSERKFPIKKVLAKVFIYFFLILLYAPLIYITVYSFTYSKTTGLWTGFSFDLYRDLFNPKNMNAVNIWTATKNTVIVALASGALATILGTLGAIGIFYLRNKALKNTMNFITQIPVVNAEIVTAVSLCILFVVTSQLFGFERSVITLIIGHTVLGLPYVVMSVTPKLEQMDPSLYEAAIDLGANRTQALWKVVIPETIPGILSGFMLSVTLSLDDYVISAFTKPVSGGFETISTYVEGARAKGALPKQLRAFIAILFAGILIVMIAMNIKVSRDARKERRNFVKE